jgi:hypothetical protein
LGWFLIWVLTWTDFFFARGTLPAIASPAVSILVRNGRLAKWIARHSSFQFRSGTLCDLEIRWQWRSTYLGSTCSTRASTGTPRRCPEQVRSSTASEGKLMGAKIFENKANEIGLVPNMTPYMDRLFFARGTPHCLAGRYYFST